MTGPRVSVLLPVRNEELYLAETLESLSAQTLADHEVIVVDDGSSDGTAERVGRLGDPKVRVQRLVRSAGVSSARNAGIQIARGTWLAFLDDDDVWSPHKLREQIAARRERPPAMPTGGFDAGARVRHSKFGEGVVVSCVPDGEDFVVTIAFRGAPGIKKLMLSMASLEATASMKRLL